MDCSSPLIKINNTRKKSQYWQVIRGICILAVIMIHCPTGQEYNAVDYSSWMALRQIINFPVALFFFMSGFFVKPKEIEKNGKTFLKTRGGAFADSLSYLDLHVSNQRGNI